MTTSSTVIADNPTMEHKIKIILDRELKTDLNSKIYQSGKIYVFYDEKLQMQPAKGNITFIPAPADENKLNLEFIFNKLYEMKIMSVLIESGGNLNGSALKFADKIYHFIAPKILGDNKARSCFKFRHADDINISDKFKIDSIEVFEPDILLTYYPVI